EMRLRSRRRQHVWINALELPVDLAAGEDIRTEISAKFHRQQLRSELESSSVDLSGWWTDPHDDYALALATARKSHDTRARPAAERFTRQRHSPTGTTIGR